MWHLWQETAEWQELTSSSVQKAGKDASPGNSPPASVASSQLLPEAVLAAFGQQQQQLLRDWAEEWERKISQRTKEDVARVSKLIFELGASSAGAAGPRFSTQTGTDTLAAVGSQLQSSWPNGRVASSDDAAAANASSPKRVCSIDFLSDELVLLPVWAEEVSAWGLSKRASHNQPMMDRYSTKESFEQEDIPPAAGKEGCAWRIIMYPGSPQKLVWDFVGALLIVHDLFAITLRVFSPPETDFESIMEWVSLIFWTLNMVVSVLTGYTEEGITIMVPERIVWRYLRTWFLVDLPVVGLDWVFTISNLLSDNPQNAGTSVRLLRILRLFRMVRLARLLKLRSLLQSFHDMLDSQYLGIIADIGTMVLILFLFSHVISCIWFLVGTIDSDANWIKDHGFEGVDWRYQYATSFHWAITQFTPSSMNVQPTNLLERTFAVIVVLFALVGFSYVVGSITGSLTQLRMMHESASTQFWELRRFLGKRNVPFPLRARIQKYLEHIIDMEKRNLPAKNVKILALLSEQLKSELECAICMPQLSVHPLLHEMRQRSRVTMHRLASTAIEHKQLAKHDPLFIAGEQATHVYFVVTGRLEYIRVDSKGGQQQEQVDHTEDWIAEPVLWMKTWWHLGDLMAEFECDLLLLNPSKFCTIVHLNPPAFRLASTYAKSFIDWIRNEDPDNLSDISQGEKIGERLQSFMQEAELPTIPAALDGKLLKSSSHLSDESNHEDVSA